MRAERRQPVDGDIVNPDDEHGHVDRQNPKHEDQHGGRVVVEIIVSARAGVSRQTKGAHAGAELHDCKNHVSELIRDQSRDEQEEDGGRDESLSASGCGEA